jgi:hypothetical protein
MVRRNQQHAVKEKTTTNLDSSDPLIENALPILDATLTRSRPFQEEMERTGSWVRLVTVRSKHRSKTHQPIRSCEIAP